MVKGYLKTMEAVIAVFFIALAIVQTTVSVDYSSQWDSIILQQAGQDALLINSYTGEMRSYVYDANFTALNASLRSVIPAYIAFNLRVSGVTVIDNGTPISPITVPFFLVGKDTYDPKNLELVLWYA